ncbi:hypothetical protein [Yoonia sp.]|uniref:hypothetical protein n=1 Tax=Yoonia sp. TaxID=2212373 RepID=UPI003975D13A
MAIATAFVPTSMPSEEVWFGTVVTENSSLIVIDDGVRKIEYFGSFSYPNAYEVTGTLNGINEYLDGTLRYSVTDIGADADRMYEAIQILANPDLTSSIIFEKDDTMVSGV